MTNPTPAEQIAAGLTTQNAGTQRRARRIAADFQPNADYDRLLEMRDSDDPRWHHIGHGKQLAAAMYEAQRSTTTETNGEHA